MLLANNDDAGVKYDDKDDDDDVGFDRDHELKRKRIYKKSTTKREDFISIRSVAYSS